MSSIDIQIPGPSFEINGVMVRDGYLLSLRINLEPADEWSLFDEIYTKHYPYHSEASGPPRVWFDDKRAEFKQEVISKLKKLLAD